MAPAAGFLLLALGCLPAEGSAATSGAESPVVIAGSPTMIPLLKRLADAHRTLKPEVLIEIDTGDATVGLTPLNKGNASAVGLARPINREEILRLQHNRARDPVGIPIAMDAVVMVVHPNNPVESLTLEQLAGVFAGEKRSWADVGVMLGGIKLHVPPQTSALHSILRARGFPKRAWMGSVKEHPTRELLIASVGGQEPAIGVCRLDDLGGVKVLPIRKDEDTEPVLPDVQTVQSRAYPLAHYLYLYTAGQPVKGVKDFIGFALSAEGQRIVADAGLVPIPFQSPGK